MPRWSWCAAASVVVLLAAACGATSASPGTPVPAPSSTLVVTTVATSISTATSTSTSTSTSMSTSTVTSTTTQAPPTTATVTPVPPVTASASTSGPAPDGLPVVGLTGVNDPSCHSDDPPVLLLHGTLARTADNYAALVPIVRAAGRCLYAVDYGNGGIGPVATSAQQFAGLVRTVRTLTGAATVDVIAYSQGGLVLRTALREDGLADQVGVAVLLAPAFHGTTSLAGSVPAQLCPACADLAAGSALLTRLDAGGDLDGSVRYAVVSTRLDTVVTPLASQVPQGPADRVRSVVVQDVCPHDSVDHVGMPADRGVIGWALAALQTRGRPPASALQC